MRDNLQKDTNKENKMNDCSWYKPWTWNRHTHSQLRQLAKTLNCFCVVEIVVVIIFTWQAVDLLTWYKSIMTPENFNGTAFWGAIIALVGAVFGACQHVNSTFKGKE